MRQSCGPFAIGAFSAKREWGQTAAVARGRGATGSETCYIPGMSKPKQPAIKVKKKGFVIGRASFGKISAVEGIRLTTSQKKRASEAERKGLSAEEYRQVIVRSYRKP